jgi:hypothetical protein
MQWINSNAYREGQYCPKTQTLLYLTGHYVNTLRLIAQYRTHCVDLDLISDRIGK